MRGVLGQSGQPTEHLGWAIGLNLLFLAAMIAWFHRTFAYCRNQGLLVRVGE